MTKTVNIHTKCGTFACRFSSSREEPGYTVTVPALKGLVTEGRTLAEAKDMAKEAIELHCEGLLASGLAKIVPMRDRVA